MQALLLERAGSLDDFRIDDVPVPEPEAGEVRVRVAACGLNPVDFWSARGGNPQWTWPHILGLDAAGTVDAVGPGVEGIPVGRRVVVHADLRRPGGFAEYTVVAAHALARIPHSVSFVTAAALPCAGLAAYQAVARRLHVAEDETVFVTAGSGGVGGFAVQLAKLAGAGVISSASAVNTDWVRGLGADEVIDYRSEDVADRVRALTWGRGVDSIVDTIGADSATDNLHLLAYAGGIACVSGRADLSVVNEFGVAPSVHEIAVGAAYSDGGEADQRRLAEDLETLLALTAVGRLNPMVTGTVGLTGVPEALQQLAGRHVRGKLVMDLSV